MDVALAIVTIVVVSSLLLQLVWAKRLTNLYRRPAAPAQPADQFPKTAVILAVRGADPSLAGCLRSLLRQDYPNYEVKVVIDSRDDPAWDLVHRATSIEGATHIQVEVLRHHRSTCSLKLSALVQAIEQLDDSYGAVALIDADGQPSPTWLRDMMTPLSEPGVGASTGVRWFVPASTDWGTLVRVVWNTAALPQMNALRIAWGGSLAFRMDAIHKAGLLDIWANSFAEDVGSNAALRRCGLTVRTVTAATLVSRESTSLTDCFRFVRRQLLCARLHHDRWPMVLFMGLGDNLATLTALVLGLVSLGAGWWGYAAWMAGLLSLQFAGFAGGLRHMAQNVRSPAASPTRLPWWTYAAVPLSQVMYLAALCGAAVARTVAWRGVTYDLGPRHVVHLRQYVPFVAPAAGRRASLI